MTHELCLFELTADYHSLYIQVAFGSDFRNWFPKLKKEGVNGEGELLGLLNHTMEGMEISLYYFFFKVSVFASCY